MLGLGSNMMKHPVTGKSIVRDGLVLQHNYNLSSVEPLSSGAASFNGTSDYIAINAKPVDTADGTYCWWSNSTQTTYQTIFSHGGNNIGGFHANNAGTNNPLLYLEGTKYQYWVDTGFADDGLWHHWAVVVDVDSMVGCKLYIDGVEIAQGSRATAGAATAYQNMEIGRYNTSNEFEGYICNFGVWSSHLSQAQVKSIMNKNYDSLSASEKTNLVSWWNLDSVIDSADLGDGDTTVYDNHYGGGEVLGGEKTTDGTFINGLASWDDSGVTESGGVVTFDNSNDYVFQSMSYTEGKVYAFTFEGTGDVQNRIGWSGTAGTKIPITLPATFYRLADSNANRVQLYGAADGSAATVTSFSVKLVNGNTGTLS